MSPFGYKNPSIRVAGGEGGDHRSVKVVNYSCIAHPRIKNRTLPKNLEAPCLNSANPGG